MISRAAFAAALCFASLWAPDGGNAAFALDARVIPLDLYLIVDGSSALDEGRDAAIAWLCDAVTDGMLMEGDNLTLWIAGEKSERIFSGPITGNGDRETIKRSLRAVVPGGGKADYASPLKEAASLDASRGEGRISLALAVGGSSPGGPSFPAERETADLLRYSRVEDFPGWRVIAAALNIGGDVHRAALSFMN